VAPISAPILQNYYIELDLTSLEPHVNGPFVPVLAHPISKLGENAKKKNNIGLLKLKLVSYFIFYQFITIIRRKRIN